MAVYSIFENALDENKNKSRDKSATQFVIHHVHKSPKSRPWRGAIWPLEEHLVMNDEWITFTEDRKLDKLEANSIAR